MRHGVLACVLCLLAASGVASASAASLPPQGIFEGCNLDTQMQTCVQRLQAMHDGGLQIVVIPAWGASLSSLSAYADAAHSLGMSVMWQIGGSDWWQNAPTSTNEAGGYPAFASACGCDENGRLLPFIVQWLGQLPATYGYYAADDTALSPGDEAGVAAYVAEIRQVDPAHTTMIGSADESQTQQYQSIPDLIGTEIYPVTTRSLMPASANQDMWGGVAQSAIDAQRFASRAGKQSAFILQAFTWGDNLSDGQAIGVCSPSDSQLACFSKLRYPSAAEQLQLRNEVLRNAHPKLIIWYSFPGTYGQTGDDTYSIYPTGSEAAARWSGLSEAIQAQLPGASGGGENPRIATGARAGARSPRARAHVALPKHRARHHRRRHHRRRHKHRLRLSHRRTQHT